MERDWRQLKAAVSRRRFLLGLAAAGGTGAFALVLSSCGGTGVTVAPSPAVTPDTDAQEATPSPTPSPTETPVPTPRPSTATPSPSPTPIPTAEPSPSPERVVTRVALVKTESRQEGVERVLQVLDLNPASGKRVVLKPNFNTADPAPGSTHNDTLRTLVLRLQEMGAAGITLAERSGPPDTAGVMRQKGIPELAEELGFELVNLQEVGPDAWVHERPGGSHWRDGFLFAKIYKDAECIVQTCCLKTHAYGGHFTMSLKNSVGLVPRRGYNYMSELHGTPNQRLLIAEINTAYQTDLIVMDGVEAFVDGGPDRGTRVPAGVMLAGTDRVAMDATGVAILRLFGTTPEVSTGRIFEQEQIARAAELGVGVDSADRIELVTADAESEEFAKRIRDILAAG